MIAFHYKVFIEVASHLSFSKAAEVLFISQPAVSKHVKKLESEVGLPLFERKGNTISLTTSGQKLLEYLHQAKKIQSQIESDVQIIKDQFKARGELRIGASTTLSLYVLPKILSAFHKNFPNVQLLLINRNSENILDALVNKEIDLAIIESHHKINAVQYQMFMHDEIIPVCASHSPYAEKPIELEQLKNFPVAIRERGSGTLALLSKELAKHHIKHRELNVIARLGGTEALKNFLLEDVAIGFLSRLAVKQELSNGSLREVNIKSFKVVRTFNFLQRKGEGNTGIVKSFIKAAKSYYNV
jgi:DNA-binding transcriptional LysR family regulator